MGIFERRPLNPTKLNRTVAKYPGLFGIPFVLLMVAASYGLSSFTQIRYDLQDKKQKQVSKEQELGLNNMERRRKFDIREEYFVRFANSRFSCYSTLSLYTETKRCWWRRELGPYKTDITTCRDTRMGFASSRTRAEKVTNILFAIYAIRYQSVYYTYTVLAGTHKDMQKKRTKEKRRMQYESE